jgi:bifunctional N-acetylglucosamine-1-phosphate-uridyltransferase/glucosamine-1-phosphate-acetyltransferase GlmU-like protein
MRFGLIMAGGLGKRMNSSIPKVLHEINSKPMICYVIDSAFSIGCLQVGIIVGKYKTVIEEKINEYYPNDTRIIWIEQNEPLGTGHAILCALDWMKCNLSFDTSIFILSGDVPLIKSYTLEQLDQNPNSILVTRYSNPSGYGRIIVKNNMIIDIVEEKDCSDKEKEINLVNCGLYSMKLNLLLNIIPLITNDNVAKEYYLTSMIKIAFDKGYIINMYELPESESIQIANINTQEDLLTINNIFI